MTISAIKHYYKADKMTQAENTYPGTIINSHQTKSRKVTRISKGVNIFIEFRMHLRRCAVIAFNTICGNIFFYLIIGLINRLIPTRPIRSIFLFYAVNEAYLRTMIYPWYAPIVKWRPGLGQIIRQDGYWCLSFGITANEKDYYNADNKELLVKLYKNVDRIRRIIGAKQMTFSGILPSIFVSEGILSESNSPENKNTVKAVIKAIDQVKNTEGMPNNCPVVVLGARGFIGQQIVKHYENHQNNIYSVDIKDESVFPVHLKGQSIIVINITKKGALKNYISALWPEAILVNEVYPEPSAEEVTMLKNRGINCYHIAGVAGFALPKFQKAYSGGIPCCASYLPDDNYNVVVTKIT